MRAIRQRQYSVARVGLDLLASRGDPVPLAWARGWDRLLSPLRRAEAGGPWAGRRGTPQRAEALTDPQRTALATLYLALMCDARLEDLGALGPIMVDGPLATDALFLATLAALRPASPVHAAGTRAGSVAGALRLAGGSMPGGSPKPAATLLHAPGLTAYRTRWRMECERLPLRC